MAMDFDPRVFVGLSGDITAFTHQDPDPDPNTVLDINQDWHLNVTWNITGPGAGLITASDWHLRINLESMGPQEEKSLIDTVVSGGSCDPASTWDNVTYCQDITVLARDPAVPLPDRVNEEGVYRLVAILTHDRVAPFPGPDRCAGFLEGPMLQFYAFA